VTGGQDTTTIRLANRLREVERLAEGLTAFAARHGIDADRLAMLNLALEEAVANVILHGYDDDDEHEIVVRLTPSGGDLEVEVEDDGRPFDPSQAPSPDLAAPLADRPVGGLGIHLVRSVADRLQWTRREGRNFLVLTFRGALPPAAP